MIVDILSKWRTGLSAVPGLFYLNSSVLINQHVFSIFFSPDQVQAAHVSGLFAKRKLGPSLYFYFSIVFKIVSSHNIKKQKGMKRRLHFCC